MQILQKFRDLVLGLAIATVFTVALVPAAPALAQDSKSQICAGLDAAGGASGCRASGTSIQKAITVAINILSLIGGIAAVIMIIVAGLKYITSGGDSSQVSSAKNTLIYAVVGIIVIAIAQALVRFVLVKVR
jgi:hypothetical protein